MAELISSENCKSMQFFYKHKLFNETQKVTPESFTFTTLLSDTKSDEFKLSWKINYSLTVSPNYGYNHPQTVHTLYNFEINLLSKLSDTDTAYVNINGCGQTELHKFDSKSITPIKTTINKSINYTEKDSSFIEVKIHIIRNDKSIGRMIENYSSYVKSENSCNVILTVGEKKFSAHKEILAVHSPVFESMFSVDMQEKNDGKVQIKDVEPHILKYLLDYIYTAKIDSIDMKDWLKLIVAADKYTIMSLLSVCEGNITNKLDAENVAEVFNVADLVKSEELKKECVKFIVKNKAVVLKTDGYKNLVKTRMDLVSEMFSYIMLCCSLELETDAK